MSHTHSRSSSAHQAAIFSPSVARAAASAAKDWSYVDDWLRSKYANTGINRGRVPSFERNSETLKALLALAAASEAADEDRDQLARVEAAALEDIRAHENDREASRRQKEQQTERGEERPIDGDLLTQDLLTALSASLTKDGQTALDALANVSIEIGIAQPTPELLGSHIVDLQTRLLAASDAAERVDLLRRYVDREAERTAAFLDELKLGDAYRPRPDLARQNLELQRQNQGTEGRLPELTRQVEGLEKAVGGFPSLTVEDVKEDEEAYLELLARKKELDAQVRAFAGLPPDIEAARAELEALRTELRDATEERDENFERLVERESPVKSRRRP